MTGKLGALAGEYRSMLKAPEVEEALDLVLFRPLAYGLVKLVQPTRVSPNQITFVSLVLGVISGVCYWQGTPAFFLAGAILLFLTNLFDCADGMLARVRGTGSLTGYLFDGLVDYTTTASVLIGMLHGLDVLADRTLFVWLVGVPGGLSFAWWSAMVDRFRNDWLDKVYGRRRDPRVELAEMRRIAVEFPPESHLWDRMLIRAYGLYVTLWYSAPSPQAVCPSAGITLETWRQARRPVMMAAVLLGPTLHLSLMMLAGALNRVDWYFIFSLFFGTAYGLVVLAWRVQVDRRLLVGEAAGVTEGAHH